MMEELTKTSRILSVYHLFLNCKEVSFQELRRSLKSAKRPPSGTSACWSGRGSWRPAMTEMPRPSIR